MLNFCDFIQVSVFTTNHHLKPTSLKLCIQYCGMLSVLQPLATVS